MIYTVYFVPTWSNPDMREHLQSILKDIKTQKDTVEPRMKKEKEYTSNWLLVFSVWMDGKSCAASW